MAVIYVKDDLCERTRDADPKERGTDHGKQERADADGIPGL